MLRPALVVSAFAAVGMVVNLLVQVSMAYLFGAQAEFDAYLAAITWPTFVNSVLLASLNYAFIPALVEFRVAGRLDEAFLLASNLLTTCCVVLAIIAALGVIFAEPLLLLTVPGFSEAKLAVAVSLARLTWPTAVLSAGSTLLTAVYQSLGQFHRPSLAPVLGSVVSLGAIWLLSPRLGIHAVVISGLLAGVAQVGMLSAIMRPAGRLRIAMNLGSPNVRRALLLALPLIVGGLFYRAAPVLERYAASMLPTGSIAHLDYAAKIVTSLVAVSLGGLSATIFPSLAENAAQPDSSRLRLTISHGLRTVWALLIPIAVIGVALRTPIVAVLFQRGNFLDADTIEVASLLPWLLLAMLGMGIGNIIGASFYAMKDTFTPALLGVLEVLVYAVYLPFAAQKFGLVGIAAAMAVYWNSGLVVFTFVLWRRLGFGGWTVARSMARSTLAAAVGGAVTLAVSPLLAGNALLTVVFGGLGGVATFALSMHVLGGRELRPAGELLHRLFRTSPGSRSSAPGP